MSGVPGRILPAGPARAPRECRSENAEVFLDFIRAIALTLTIHEYVSKLQAKKQNSSDVAIEGACEGA